MKKLAIRILIIFLIFYSVVLPQSGAMDLFNTSRYARAIRLGNAYTGVAEGTETLFYNTAGIANLNSYSVLVSQGQGFGIFTEDVKAYDYAIIIPLFNNYGTIGVSANTLTDKFIQGRDGFYIYTINYARNLADDISVGIAANYYYLKFSNLTTSSSPDETKSISGSAIDINLAVLYRFPESFTFSSNDKFQVGFQIKNILNTKIKYDNFPQEDYKFQNIRAGFSYNYNPNFEKVFGLSPLKFMFAFDAVFKGADYDFTEWQPNFGIELTLFEILQLSFGRENEIQIKEIYSYSPQHPVNRYGAGIKIPFHKFFDLSNRLELKFDYCISDWQKIDEDNVQPAPFWNIKKIDKKAFSLGLTLNF